MSAIKKAEHTTRVTIFDGARYASDWPPENAVEFIHWLHSKIAEAPTEYRDGVVIEVRSTMSYGDDEARIEIYYYRPENDEERHNREQYERALVAHREREELATLARLKKKYGK